MRPTCTRIVVAALLAVAVLDPAPARAKVAACPGGRYLVAGAPLVDVTGEPATDVVHVAGRTISTASGCAAARGRVRGTKAGTRLVVRFKACEGLLGKARVKGMITDGCQTLTGTFTAKSLGATRPFVASLSRCGDGVWDPGGGEACDGDLGPCGALCEACSCGGVTTTTGPGGTTTTGATTSTIVTTTTSTMPAFTTTTTVTTTTIVAPDLQVTGVMFTNTAAARSILSMAWTVKNNGSATATASWWDYVLFSTDTAFGGDTALNGYQRTTNLAPGAQYSPPVPFNVTMPNVAAGNYYVFIHADGGNALVESNDNNNVSGAVLITITNGDLSPQSLTAPGSTTAGATIAVGYSVKNLSTTSSAVGPWNDQIFLSADAAFGGDTLIGTWTESLAGANGTYNRNRNVTIPAVAPGTYRLFLKADSVGETSETNEGNNVFGPVTITVS